MTVSAIEACTNRRCRLRHTCPALANADITSRGIALSRSASGSIITPELLPSSSVTRLRPAIARMRSPTSGLPVNEILAGPGCRTSASPVVAPSPCTTSSTPSGSPASASVRASATAVSGVRSAGLSTTVLPAARAGATLCATRLSGKLNGVIAATTPDRHAQIEPDAAFAGGGGVERHGLAVQALRLLGRELERLDAARDLGGRVAPRLPRLARNQLGQRVALARQQIGRPSEDRRALVRGDRGPGRRGDRGARHRAMHVGGRGLTDLAEPFT